MTVFFVAIIISQTHGAWAGADLQSKVFSIFSASWAIGSVNNTMGLVLVRTNGDILVSIGLVCSFFENEESGHVGER